MKNHISGIFIIVLVFGLSLNSCVEPRYMEKNNQPVRNERRHQREDRRNEHRGGLRDGLKDDSRENRRDDRRNEHRVGPFTFIFPQVSS